MSRTIERVLFVSAFDYPTRFAHARHGFEMARAYTRQFGSQFLFVINAVLGDTLQGIPHRTWFGRYGRRIKKLRLRSVVILARLFFMFIGTRRWCGPSAMVVTTDARLAVMLAYFKKLFGFTLVVECHGTFTPREEAMLQLADCVAFTTEGLRREVVARHPAIAQKSVVAPNAVDVEVFSRCTDAASDLRTQLSLPVDAYLIGYIGRFEPMGADKGLKLMIDALHELPESTHVVLVGGSRHEVPAYHEYAQSQGLSSRVHIVPHVDAALIPHYAKACDVLAYVPGERTAFFETETSPMKVFEYMAAERPIVVSDTPALREILAEREALFVEPGNRSSFAKAIRSIQEQPDAARDRAGDALRKVKENTWDARARRIVQAAESML